MLFPCVEIPPPPPLSDGIFGGNQNRWSRVESIKELLKRWEEVFFFRKGLLLECFFFKDLERKKTSEAKKKSFKKLRQRHRKYDRHVLWNRLQGVFIFVGAVHLNNVSRSHGKEGKTHNFLLSLPTSTAVFLHPFL